METYYPIDDLRCLCFWSKKYACALRGRLKLQGSHYQNKHLTRTLFERHSLLFWPIMPDFCCAFECSNKRKAGSNSNISYYRIPFGTDPESLSQKKVDSSNQEYAASISSVISQRKLWWIVRSLVFLFVSVAFKILLLRQAIKRQRFSRLCPIGIFLYSKYWRKEKKFSWLIWKAD